MGPPDTVDGVDSIQAQKLALRDQLLTDRNRRPLLEVAEASRAFAEQLCAMVEIRRAATVAAYASVGTEPGTGVLLEDLLALGKRVILPVVQPDLDLDWAVYTGERSLAPAGRGLLEPTGVRLGPEAVATADVVVTPGLAVDWSGMRMGRGGGCYDRALGRVPVGTPVVTMLYDGEVLDAVPSAAHDRRVTTVVTPRGVTRLARA